MLPKISVIMPVYNVEKYLRACLDSIIQQTFQDWECILVNDGSSDNSGRICDEYCQRDSRFKVIHKDNGGVSSARNRGLDIAKGEMLTFVDSDDRITDDALEYMLARYVDNNADVCVCTNNRNSEASNLLRVLDEKEKRNLIWACLAYRTDRYVKAGFLVDAPYAKLFRTSIIRNNNIRFVEGLCKSEDALFDAEFYYHAKRIILVDHPVYYYTLNPDSICHTYNKAHIGMLATLIELEQEFVDTYYNSDFRDVVKVRAVSALLQVLYENNAHKQPMRERMEALRLLFKAENVASIITNTRYSEIKPYFKNELSCLDFWLAKKYHFTALCKYIDFSIAMLKARVMFVSYVKKLLGINQDRPIATIFTKR